MTRRRRFRFAAKRRCAPSVASGAMTTSVKISAIAAAVSSSRVPFSATMPPKAEVRSQS